MGNNHEFALYYPQLSEFLKESIIVISEKVLVHRITKILRLQKNEELTLFDALYHAKGIISTIDKKSVVVQVETFERNNVLTPFITVQIGLLKREALEHVIESLTVFGVNEIQLYLSEKVSRKWGGQKEMERLQRVMVAAAEQSKQFVLPEIKAPADLFQLLQSETIGIKIFCDPDGESIKPFICQRSSDRITLLIGPEGDLTQIEKEVLAKNK